MSGHGNQDADYLNGRHKEPIEQSDKPSVDNCPHIAACQAMESCAGLCYTKPAPQPSADGLTALVKYRLPQVSEKTLSDIRAYAERLAALPEAAPVPQGVRMPPAEFEAWLCEAMPAGTQIGNPSWWAPRIWRAAMNAGLTMQSDRPGVDGQVAALQALIDKYAFFESDAMKAAFLKRLRERFAALADSLEQPQGPTKPPVQTARPDGVEPNKDMAKPDLDITITVSGKAGVGKTRLALSLERFLADKGWPVELTDEEGPDSLIGVRMQGGVEHSRVVGNLKSRLIEGGGKIHITTAGAPVPARKGKTS